MKKIGYILLVLTIGLTLLSCADTADTGTGDTTTAATTAATTVDRDKIVDSGISEDEIAFRQAVWAAVKDTVDDAVTINDLWVSNFKKVDDVFMGHYSVKQNGNPAVTGGPMITTVTVGGYDFIFGSNLIPSIFTDGKRYSLETAFSCGAITEDQLRQLWEQHKEGNSFYDEK